MTQKDFNLLIYKKCSGCCAKPTPDLTTFLGSTISSTIPTQAPGANADVWYQTLAQLILKVVDAAGYYLPDDPTDPDNFSWAWIKANSTKTWSNLCTTIAKQLAPKP